MNIFRNGGKNKKGREDRQLGKKCNRKESVTGSPFFFFLDHVCHFSKISKAHYIVLSQKLGKSKQQMFFELGLSFSKWTSGSLVSSEFSLCLSSEFKLVSNHEILPEANDLAGRLWEAGTCLAHYLIYNWVTGFACEQSVCPYDGSFRRIIIWCL